MVDIESINKDLQVNETVSSAIEIKYKPAKMIHRVMANLFDILIFLLLTIALFLGCRAITIRNDNYKEAYAGYRHAQIESGLYYDDKSQAYPNIIEYLDKDSGVSQIQKHKLSLEAIKKFYTYIVQEDSVTSEIRTKIDTKYTEYFTKDLKHNDFPYIESFEIVGNEINIVECDYSSASVEDNVPHDVDYYRDVYKPFVNDELLAVFGSYSTEYRVNIAKVGKMFVLIDAPISVSVAGLLVYLVPALCFRRGHKTFGKAMYHIGLIDSRYLNVSWKRFLARFAIFYFGILLLSVFTLGVPMLISTSLMFFSKKKQGFPDYMLGLREVDTSTNKIYYSLEEINLSSIDPHHKPVDFRPEKEL